jgi:hypothetical protein
MINKMEKDNNLGLIKQFIKVNTKMGKKHGKGKFMWTDDSSYEGEFF